MAANRTVTKIQNRGGKKTFSAAGKSCQNTTSKNSGEKFCRSGFLKMASSIGTTFRCSDCFNILVSDPESRWLVGHDSECIQRLVPCPFAQTFMGQYNECNERIKFKNLFRHCESKHGKMEVMKNGTSKTHKERMSRDIPFFTTWPVKIEAYGRVFITEAATKDQVFYQWVKLLGSPSEAEGFLFSLEYKGPGSTHVYFGKVAAIDDTMDNVISSGKSSSFGFRIFKNQFMEDWDGANTIATIDYSWSITVKKLDE